MFRRCESRNSIGHVERVFLCHLFIKLWSIATEQTLLVFRLRRAVHCSLDDEVAGFLIFAILVPSQQAALIVNLRRRLVDGCWLRIEQMRLQVYLGCSHRGTLNGFIASVSVVKDSHLLSGIQI